MQEPQTNNPMKIRPTKSLGLGFGLTCVFMMKYTKEVIVCVDCKVSLSLKRDK